MGYTHYFTRSVSLSLKQRIDLCIGAAKILSYWFDHTPDCAALFEVKGKPFHNTNKQLENSQRLLTILSSAKNREEELCRMWEDSNEIFVSPVYERERLNAESFKFPFNGDPFLSCTTNLAKKYGPLVFGLFYFCEISGFGRATSDYESRETTEGRRLIEDVFPMLVKDYSNLAIKPYQQQTLSDSLEDWNFSFKDGNKVCLVYKGGLDIGSNRSKLEFEVTSLDDLVAQVRFYTDSYDLNRHILEQVKMHGDKTDIKHEFRVSERYQNRVLSELCYSLVCLRDLLWEQGTR